MADRPERKFVFAPDMAKLAERVKAAEDASSSAQEAAEGAQTLLDELADQDDLLARLSYLVLAVRDHRAGTLDGDELFDRARHALDGIRDQLPEFIRAELGTGF